MIQKQRILLTGSNGLVGQNVLSQLLFAGGYDILATSASEDKYPHQIGYHFIPMDIRNREKVLQLADAFCPDILIHCAAMTQVDPCELQPELALEVNLEGTRNLAELAVRCGAHLIFVSTDFVFSGENGPYCEEDMPAPVNYYGQTKWLAEEWIMGLSTPWSIVRTILVYGVAPSMGRSNLVLWVKSSLENGQQIRVVDDQYRMPTLVDDLALGIVQMARQKAEGVFHLSGPDLHSVYDLARQTADFFGLDRRLIRPISSDQLSQAGRRPPKTGFVLDKAREIIHYQPKNFKEGLQVVQNLLVTLKKT